MVADEESNGFYTQAATTDGNSHHIALAICTGDNDHSVYQEMVIHQQNVVSKTT